MGPPTEKETLNINTSSLSLYSSYLNQAMQFSQRGNTQIRKKAKSLNPSQTDYSLNFKSIRQYLDGFRSTPAQHYDMKNEIKTKDSILSIYVCLSILDLQNTEM